MNQVRRIEAGNDGHKSVAVASSYEGPLPPPEMLKAYNECLPGSGEIILGEFKKQGGHRRFVESAIVVGRLYFGPLLGLFVIIAGFILGYKLIIDGKSTEGFLILITPLAGLATVFLFGRKSYEKSKR